MDKIPGMTLLALAWIIWPSCATLWSEGWGSNISPAEGTHSPLCQRVSTDGAWDIMFHGKTEKVATTLYAATMSFCTISWQIVYVLVAQL